MGTKRMGLLCLVTYYVFITTYNMSICKLALHIKVMYSIR